MSAPLNKETLDRDYYYVQRAGASWHRNQLISSRLPWQWVQSDRDVLVCPEAKSCASLASVAFVEQGTTPSVAMPSPIKSPDTPKTVCLNMIVKNEAHVIERCLNSVKPLIDSWVIVDTGSVDGTQAIIRKCMEGIPGELYESPFVNFEASRNQAIDLAHNWGDYLLFIDADETLVFDHPIDKRHLLHDFYYLDAHYGGMRYLRSQLINNHLPWRWVGVLHEYLECPGWQTHGVLDGVYNFIRAEGARSKDPKKFQKDAQLLEAALKKDPLNRRYTFYLAQSYRDAGDPASALKWYLKRSTMGGFDQEVFWSLYMVAALREQLHYADPIVVRSYLEAYMARPTRLEPLYLLTRYLRTHDKPMMGYMVSLLGRSLPISGDSLFVERWMHDYGIELEHSVCAYWTGRYFESYLSSMRILDQPELPDDIVDTVTANIGWTRQQLGLSRL